MNFTPNIWYAEPLTEGELRKLRRQNRLGKIKEIFTEIVVRLIPIALLIIWLWIVMKHV
jgi:hypothetical protein